MRRLKRHGMNILLAVSLVTALTLACLSPGPRTTVVRAEPADRDAQVQADIVDHYVDVLGNGAGTLVEVKDELYVLTASHVAKCVDSTLSRERAHRFTDADGEAVWAVYERGSPGEPEGCDMALYKVLNPKGLSGVHLADRYTKLVPGETAFAIGTAWGFHRRLDRGSIDNESFQAMGATWNLFSGHGWFGSSGGGLYVWRSGHWVLAGVTNRITEAHHGACLMARETCDMIAFLGVR